MDTLSTVWGTLYENALNEGIVEIYFLNGFWAGFISGFTADFVSGFATGFISGFLSTVFLSMVFPPFIIISFGFLLRVGSLMKPW